MRGHKGTSPYTEEIGIEYQDMAKCPSYMEFRESKEQQCIVQGGRTWGVYNNPEAQPGREGPYVDSTGRNQCRWTNGKTSDHTVMRDKGRRREMTVTD